jgi:hypothetical protein
VRERDATVLTNGVIHLEPKPEAWP